MLFRKPGFYAVFRTMLIEYMDVLGWDMRRTWEEAAAKWLEETSHKRDHIRDQFKIRWIAPYWKNKWLDEIDRETVARLADLKAKTASMVRRYAHLSPAHNLRYAQVLDGTISSFFDPMFDKG